MRNLVILGVTGSIGTQTLKVLETRKDYNLVGISCFNNVDAIDKILKKINTIKSVAIVDSKCNIPLKKKYPKVKFYFGSNANVDLISNQNADVYLNSISGFNGLIPSVEILKKNKVLLLANKETLVVGGQLINELLIEHPLSKLIPVDSEHVAISKCLTFGNKKDIKKIVITASGGKFFDYRKKDLQKVKYDEVLSHPNWKMGKKITVDSNTMMNKTFELIEAYYLFNLPYNKIKAIVNRKSVVHGFVEFKDFTVAQVSEPTMLYPIIYSLDYYKQNRKFDDCKINSLNEYTFSKLKVNRFPFLKFAKFVIKKQGDAGCVLNAVDEEVVKAFINKKISFDKIIPIVFDVMKQYRFTNKYDINHLLKIDKEIRTLTREVIKKYV